MGFIVVLFSNNFWCLLLNWPIFLMFTVSKEITVKSLEGSSDLFVNLRKSSTVFGNRR